jgi:HPt (histidine-containing phosphotransfer) domain-containing protein
MHKLRGGAGNVGARAIHRLATQAEAACAAGDRELASQLAQRLAVELQSLRHSAEPMFEAARGQAGPAEAVARAQDGSIEPQRIVDLITLLRQQSLQASDQFNAISSQIRSLLGDRTYQRVRRQIDNLQYGDAATALETASSPAG